jgi:hypothetical protein
MTPTSGVVSIRVARPLGRPITAISVATRSTCLTDVTGSLHLFMISGFPLGVLRPRDHALGAGHEVQPLRRAEYL